MKHILLLLLLVNVLESNSQTWKTDLKEALETARLENKKVLLYFSVPEACESCIALEKNVFSSEEFKIFASEKYILAKAAFSGEEEQSVKEEILLIVEKYNKDGFFPWVVILDNNGKAVGKSGVYNNESSLAYINRLRSLER